MNAASNNYVFNNDLKWSIVLALLAEYLIGDRDPCIPHKAPLKKRTLDLRVMVLEDEGAMNALRIESKLGKMINPF